VSDERATLGPWRVERVAETGSTNADLVARARLGEPAGVVLVADHQTAGRGRLGRAWAAPPGASLLLSVLLRPPPGVPLHGATQAVGLAARGACGDVTGVLPALKWPNDLLVGPRKLAGVLAEAVAEDGRVAAVVVGIGLNVQWGDDVPSELAERLVALDHLTGGPVDREAVLAAFLDHLTRRVAQWQQAPADLAADYRLDLATLGQEVRVDRGGDMVVGVAVDLTDVGELVVDAGGDLVTVSAGEVVHLRPA